MISYAIHTREYHLLTISWAYWASPASCVAAVTAVTAVAEPTEAEVFTIDVISSVKIPRFARILVRRSSVVGVEDAAETEAATGVATAHGCCCEINHSKTRSIGTVHWEK